MVVRPGFAARRCVSVPLWFKFFSVTSETSVASKLEFTVDEMRAMADAVVRRSIDHIATLPSQPACGDVDPERVRDVCRAMKEPAPEQGTALEPLLDRLFGEWVPRSFTAAGPGYLAYIPGGGLYPAALADFIADTT